MRVKLLRDIDNGGKVKVRARRGRPPVALFEGTVIEMSDTSAKKYIDKGWAEPVEEETKDEEKS